MRIVNSFFFGPVKAALMPGARRFFARKSMECVW